MATTREVNGMTITPGLYRHTQSGGFYTVFGVVRHHETNNPMVVYYSHGHGSVSTRPLYGFVGARCSDPDGFADRFELLADASRGHPGPGLPAAELWTSDTLRRNFDLFEAALLGVGPSESKARSLSAAIVDINNDTLTAAVTLLERALEMVRKEQFQRAKASSGIETPNVGAPPNTSVGTMDSESSLGRI